MCLALQGNLTGTVPSPIVVTKKGRQCQPRDPHTPGAWTETALIFKPLNSRVNPVRESGFLLALGTPPHAQRTSKIS